jgi:type IV secretion system protein VirD4
MTPLEIREATMINIIRALFGAVAALACRILLCLACAVMAIGLATIASRVPVIGFLGLAYVAWRRLRRRGASDSYGTATTASLSQMESGGLLSEDGLILGRCLAEPPSLLGAALGLFSPWISSELACRTFLAALFGGGWIRDRLIRVTGYVHLLTCSPAGGGKGVAALIPNLLSYRGNAVVIDPKGELFRATAKHRRRKFGHRIIRLDPYNVCGLGGDSLNPLDFIDEKAPDFLDQCRDIANMLIIRQHDEKDPHWNDSAEANATAFAAFVCGCEPDRSKRHLGTMRALASSPGRYAKAVEVMQATDACDGVIRRMGGQLAWFGGDELASVQTTFARHTNFLDSPAVTRNIASSSFDPLILRRGKATVYLILPHDRLASLSRLQRLWIGTIMRRTTRGPVTERNPVLWLLDEMAHIGHMQAIEDAVTLMRGMGVRLWFIFQSLSQVKTCFGEKAQTVLDNCGTLQFFAVNSYETAEEISKRIGDTTIAISSVNDTTGHSHPTGFSAQPQSSNRSDSRSVTHSEIARRLLKPEEVITLSPEVCLIFHKHLPVVVGRLVRHYNSPEFRWGGTAAPRRLGIAAGILAAFTLAASTMISAVALAVVPPPRRGRPPVGRSIGRAPVAAAHAQPAVTHAKAPVRPARRPNSRQHRRPGPSGHLIKIE